MISLGLTEAMRDAAREQVAEKKAALEREMERRRAEAYQAQLHLHAQQQAWAAEQQAAAQAGYRPPQFTPPRQRGWNVQFDQGWQQQIPHPVFTPPPPLPEWVRVLGVSPAASRADIERAYRRLVKTAHPDAGGTQDAMVTLNRAIAAARLVVPS